MSVTVIFHGASGEETSTVEKVEMLDGLSLDKIERGWKTLLENNRDALLEACRNPHPYVPD